MRVLLLGGTGEARQLAAALATTPGVDVISSLAGRVHAPALPEGTVRIGGFHGADGLTDWLRAERIDAVVDATHAFAARITRSAVQACAARGVPLLVLRRPEWEPRPGDDWHPVADLHAAAALLPQMGRRVFLTSGRQGIAEFTDLEHVWFLVRTVDPPECALPANMELLLARGPFTVDGEVALLREHRIDVLVTKNSGGPMTEAKLVAARELGIAVIMVERPVEPEVPRVGTVEEAFQWLRRADAARDY